MQKSHRLLQQSSRNWVVLSSVFCTALALRLLFVLAGPPEPMTWMDRWQSDEMIYVNAAKAVLDFSRGAGNPAEAVDLLARRGPVYPLYLALAYGLLGNSSRVVGIAQALTDAGSCALIYLLTKQVLSWRAGVLSSGIAVLYTPFILSTGRHLREPLASFLLLLVALFVTKAIITWSRKTLAFGGAALGFTILCNSSAQYLPPVLLLGMIGLFWRKVSRLELGRGLLVFLVALTAPLALWMITTSASIGTPLVSAAASSYYRTGGFLNNLDTDGWITDYYLRGLLSRREAMDLLRESGFTEDVVPEFTQSLDFRLRVAARIVGHYPVAFFTVPVKNFYRLWTVPDNMFRYSLMFSYPQQVSLHQVLVCLGLLGIPLSLVVAGRKPVVLLLILAYFCVVWMATHAEPRYNLPLMPYVIVMAACTIDFLCIAARKIRGTAYERRFCLAWVVSFSLGVLSVALAIPLLLPALGAGASVCAYRLTVLLRGLLLVSLGPVLYLMARVILDSKKSAAVSVFPVLALVAGFALDASTSKTWHEWTTRLSHPSQRIRQTIVYAETFKVGSFTESTLMIDMHGGPNKSYDLVVEVNGEKIRRYEDGLHVDPGKFDSFHRFYNQLITARNMVPDDLRQWFEISVDPRLLTGRDTIVVEVYLASDVRSGGNYVDIYGDYPAGDERVFDGPSFPLSPLDTSLYKYEYDDDFRLESTTRLESSHSSSAYYDGFSWSFTDLSPEAGMQSGEFRVRLRLLRDDGTAAIL